MNRTAAEKAAREIIERYIPAIGDPTNAVADIIERACGETAWVSVKDIRTQIAVWRFVYQEQIDTGDHEAAAISEDIVLALETLLPSPPTGRTEEK